MAGELEAVLRRVGPCLTSTAAAELVKQFGGTDAAARQRVARRGPGVRELDLPFARKASFIYLPEQYQSPRFLQALTEALEANNGAYARTVQAVAARGGILPVAHLPVAAGLGAGDGQLDADEVRARLVKAQVLAEINVPGVGGCLGFAGTTEYDDVLARMKARLIAEDLVLGAVKTWARNLAIGSYGLFSLRGSSETRKVGRFEWDLTAPCYLAGVSGWDSAKNRPIPGSLVADVLLTDSVDLRGVRPFIYKTETLRLMKVQRCLQIFLADGFTPEALQLLRRHGVIPGRIDELFGIEVARALKELISTLTQTAAAAFDPENFERLFNSLGRFEGAAGTLRGALFEFIAADLLREDGWANVVMNKLYREAGRDLAEVDVRAEKGDEVLFVECKGIVPGKQLDDAEVKRWLEQRIPAVYARARANEEFSNRKFRFELWTTGLLSTDAKDMIDQARLTIRATKYALDVRYGPDLRNVAKAHTRRNRTVLKILDQHFLTSPLLELKVVAEEASKPSLWPPLLAEPVHDFSRPALIGP